MKLEVISKYPSGSTYSTPLLFVHGAWHAVWCWDVHFLDYFAQHGFATHVLSLRGHGKSEGRDKLRWTRIAEYVEDVATIAKTLPSPSVLIGHSMGGFIVQKYLEDHLSPAAVLLASAPPTGLLATTIRMAKRHPAAFAKINLKLSLYPIVATPNLARETLFSDDLAEEQILAYWKLLQDESIVAFLYMIAFNLPKPGKIKTNMLVLGGARDNILTSREIEETAKIYNAQLEIFSDMAHDMMLESRWEAVAERILAWLKDRKLTQQ